MNLPCRTGKDEIRFVEWRRADLREYVALYRDEQLLSNHQHSFFKNRVFLERLKDGDASVIVKDITIDDSGAYTCNTRLLNKLVYLRVIDRQGSTESRYDKWRDVFNCEECESCR